MEGLSKISSTLMVLICKNVKLEWMDACEKSFQEMKERLVTTLILTIPEGEDGFLIYCDVSG